MQRPNNLLLQRINLFFIFNILLKLFWNEKIFCSNHNLTWLSLCTLSIRSLYYLTTSFLEVWRLLIKFLKLLVDVFYNLGPRRMHWWRLLLILNIRITHCTFHVNLLKASSRWILKLILLCIIVQDSILNLFDCNLYQLTQLVH